MENKGTVYFFTGLSGAGKTTLGGLFCRRLKNTKPNVVYLDGDEIRPVFGEDSGYTQEDRLRWAGRIFRVCKMLSDQGIDVICCSIAMFESVRKWNRKNIENYKEIYIKVKKETLLARNQKGLYTSGHHVVGVDLPFDEPKHPDLVIENDGGQTPLELVELVPADEAVGDELEQPQRRVLVDGVGIALADQARKLLLHAAEAFRERILVNAPFGPPAYQADGLCLHVGEARRPLPAGLPEEVVQIVVTHGVLFFW